MRNTHSCFSQWLSPLSFSFWSPDMERLGKLLLASAVIFMAGAFIAGPVISLANIQSTNMPQPSIGTHPVIQRGPVTSEAAVKITTATGHGSGVHIGRGYIVTSAHVIKGNAVVSVKTEDGKTAAATILWSDAVHDIALLRTPLAMPAADMSCTTEKVGTTVMAVGNPMGQEFVSAFGHIASAARELPGLKRVMVTDMTVVMGQSGGPVFAGDKLVGIMAAVMLAPLQSGVDQNGAAQYVPSLVGFGYVVPSSTVCELMGRV